ncbi:carboxylesterase/lipase family protein [Vibrio tapetis]|uniref:Carboxylic ester hydrolase n=1 Tax=Vibrio tapetis subsp. tapetis TaxID=1671868 RepID=A0A2N8ZJK3_9VIBR|nr:carboxylesterase family protein [Vibrio tapetis]SON52081.1 Carboxylesterase [Vibrio tapetis subsp. tapetis]
MYQNLAFSDVHDKKIEIDSGLLLGSVNRNTKISVFKGIPFAAPPVGNLRWAAPEPIEKWQGVRRAKEYGASSIQTLPEKGSFYQKEFLPKPHAYDEDCLYLNVWAPEVRTNERVPVLVWFYPGGFVWGSGSDDSIDGTALARKGAVVVTINYRVGVLGFMAHPELTKESPNNTSGNYGLLDQISALKWVQRNITQFGGDKTNVTISGLSAGAISAHLLSASPRAKGLFHKIIAQSGSVFAMKGHATLENNEAAGIRYANSLGVSSINQLRKFSPEELMAKPYKAWPVVDGWLLPESVSKAYEKGQQMDVPMLIGGTSEEAATIPHDVITLDTLEFWAKSLFGDYAEEYLKLNPAKTDEQARDNFVSAKTESIHWATRKWAKQQKNSGSEPIYLYSFSKAPPGEFSALHGAYHMGDLVYAFNNLDAVDRPWTQEDRELAELMSSAWFNFAKTGNPNGGSLPLWPTYSNKDDVIMVFDSKTEAKVDKRETALHRLYDKEFSKNKGYLKHL